MRRDERVPLGARQPECLERVDGTRVPGDVRPTLVIRPETLCPHEGAISPPVVLEKLAIPAPDQEIDETVAVEVTRGQVTSREPRRESARLGEVTVPAVEEDDQPRPERRRRRDVGEIVAVEVRGHDAPQRAALAVEMNRLGEPTGAVVQQHGHRAVEVAGRQVGRAVAVEVGRGHALRTLAVLLPVRPHVRVTDVEPAAEGLEVLEELRVRAARPEKRHERHTDNHHGELKCSRIHVRPFRFCAAAGPAVPVEARSAYGKEAAPDHESRETPMNQRHFFTCS